MSDLYTSYATSLALKEAGAEQAGAERLWCVHPSTEAVELVSPGALFYRGGVRAWRLDEIHAELVKTSGRDVVLMQTYCGITTTVEVFDEHAPVTSSLDGCESTPVEAAAACYLAVLRAGSGR